MSLLLGWLHLKVGICIKGLEKHQNSFEELLVLLLKRVNSVASEHDSSKPTNQHNVVFHVTMITYRIITYNMY